MSIWSMSMSVDALELRLHVEVGQAMTAALAGSSRREGSSRVRLEASTSTLSARWCIDCVAATLDQHARPLVSAANGGMRGPTSAQGRRWDKQSSETVVRLTADRKQPWQQPAVHTALGKRVVRRRHWREALQRASAARDCLPR